MMRLLGLFPSSLCLPLPPTFFLLFAPSSSISFDPALLPSLPPYECTFSASGHLSSFFALPSTPSPPLFPSSLLYALMPPSFNLSSLCLPTFLAGGLFFPASLPSHPLPNLTSSLPLRPPASLVGASCVVLWTRPSFATTATSASALAVLRTLRITPASSSAFRPPRRTPLLLPLWALLLPPFLPLHLPVRFLATPTFTVLLPAVTMTAMSVASRPAFLYATSLMPLTLEIVSNSLGISSFPISSLSLARFLLRLWVCYLSSLWANCITSSSTLPLLPTSS